VGDLAPILTAGGGLGVVVLVILYLLNSNRQDRRDYRSAIDDAENRADRAETRERATQVALDEARSARRTAEDHADLLARELARHRPPEVPP
jgi:hypothetical protein